MERLFKSLVKGFTLSQQAQAAALSLGLPSNAEVGYHTRQPWYSRDPELLPLAIKAGFSTEHKRYTAKECLIFALRDRKGEIAAFYCKSISGDKELYLPRNDGFYPKTPDPHTRRLVIAGDVVEAAKARAECPEPVLALTNSETILRLIFDGLPGLSDLVLLEGVDPDFTASCELLALKGVKVRSLTLADLRDAFDEADEPPFQPLEALKRPPDDAYIYVLDDSQPLALHFKAPEFTFIIYGGVQATTDFNKLRITLVATTDPESRLQAYRQNLDLYNNDEVRLYASYASPKLEVARESVEDALAALTAALEEYRLQPLEPPAVRLGRGALQAETYLKREDLMHKLAEDLADLVVDEQDNVLTLFLTMTSRLLEHPLSAVVRGGRASGKSCVLQQIASLFPEEHLFRLTALSANCLYYVEGLDKKIILIDDLEQSHPLGIASLREIITSGVLSRSVPERTAFGGFKAGTYAVRASVSVVGATHRTSYDFALPLHLNDKPENDAKVLEFQRLTAVQGGFYRNRELFQNLQRLLRPVTVCNPYAPELTLPTHVSQPRRVNAWYLKLIETITFLHQYARAPQTDADGRPFIAVEPADIEFANRLMLPVLLARSDEISTSARNLLENIKAYLHDKKTEAFRAPELRAHYRLNPGNLKRWLRELLAYGYLSKDGTQRKGFIYRVTEPQAFGALTQSVRDALKTMAHDPSNEACPVQPPENQRL